MHTKKLPSDNQKSGVEARISKWGNSLAFRVPQPLLAQAGFSEGENVLIVAYKDRIVIRPKKEKKYTLQELLDGVTEDNQPGLVSFGPPQGNEAW